MIIYNQLKTCCSLVLSIGFSLSYFFISETARASSSFIWTLCLSMVKSPDWGMYPNSFKNSNSSESFSNFVSNYFMSCWGSVWVLAYSIFAFGSSVFFTVWTSMIFPAVGFLSCFSFSFSSCNFSPNTFILVLFYFSSSPSLSLFIVYKTCNFLYKAFQFCGSIFIACSSSFRQSSYLPNF